MKKLLLILICLFVSFEVKSESDDLTGKKLLCGKDQDKGFEFLSHNEVRNYDISNIASKQITISGCIWDISNDVSNINYLYYIL